MSFKRYEYGSASNGELAEGCKYCIQGSKMVLLVTGRCNTGCFYCPVSAEKKGKDVVYANERRVTTPEEIIEEAESMDAAGTGITGGDPLITIDRTIRCIKLLKDRFGKEHHIHLYTSMIDAEMTTALQAAGLDEIRFHPSMSQWCKMNTTDLKKIIDTVDIDVGIEVPAIPGHEKELEALVDYATSAGVKFINLNELEFSESNWEMMEEHNYNLKDDLSSSILGSEEVAIGLMKKHKKAPIHFCSSIFKDGVQLRNRLIRRAEHIAKPYDVITKDGTILKGIIYADDLEAVRELLNKTYEVPDELIFIDSESKRMEVASWVLEELAKDLPFKCYIVEEYSTVDRLEVERTPLN